MSHILYNINSIISDNTPIAQINEIIFMLLITYN